MADQGKAILNSAVNAVHGVIHPIHAGCAAAGCLLHQVQHPFFYSQLFLHRMFSWKLSFHAVTSVAVQPCL